MPLRTIHVVAATVFDRPGIKQRWAMGPPTFRAARRDVLVELHQSAAASPQQLPSERDAAYPGGCNALGTTTHTGATRTGEEEGAAVKGPTPDAPLHKASAQTPSNAEETSRKRELGEGSPTRDGKPTATGRRGVNDTGDADRRQSGERPTETLAGCGKKGSRYHVDRPQRHDHSGNTVDKRERNIESSTTCLMQQVLTTRD